MVRMGEQLPAQAEAFLSTAVHESEEMADQLASTFRVDVDSADVSEVASMLAKEIGNDAFLRANGAKFERELYEKYGVLKDVILHPTVQWLLGLCAQLWRSFHLFGRPPLGTGAGVVVGLMIYRKKVGFFNMCLTVAVLSGLNPFVVVAVVLAWKLWASSKFLPRGCRFNPEFEAPDDLGADKLSDDFEPGKVSAAGAAGEEYDHVVVGSDLGGLFCAALLSRCGRRVLVLEQGPILGAGAVVKAPEGAGDWEFETGVQCLGGGGKLGRFVKRLQLACLPGKERIRWEKVGQLESDLCVHDMVSIGDGQQAVMFPAEQDKLLESLLAQFPERRGFFRAFFGQAEKEMAGGSMAYYLLKLFSSRPARWLDRVVIGAFVAAPAMAHVAIAQRSVSEMVNAMMKTQPDGNSDSGAAQAALCALFRSENLDPARVSCAALMGQTSSAWGGLYHPRGGFRAVAEELVDAIHASGGRALTRARATSVIVKDGRAAGVTVAREVPGTPAVAVAAAAATAAGVRVMVAGDGSGSVISSVGVIDSFRGLVPRSPAAAAEAGAGAGTGAGVRGPSRRREAPLTEREGFAVAKKVLPGGGEGLEMDLEALRLMRSQVNKLKRSMRQAVEEENYKKAGELRNEVAAIRAKDPLYVVSDLLGIAVSKEKFKRAARLRDAKDWILRESRGSVFEVDRLVCLGDKASNIITTDPEGATVRRFLRSDQIGEISRTGQIQLPVWSPDGRMVAFSVLKAGSGGAPIESAKILVYRESGSLVLDVAVPRAPFLLMWSPNSQSLTYLSNAEGPGGATIRLSEILVAAATSPYKTKTRGLAQGNPLFYAYTKKDTRNSDMVVHTANRVYFLDMTTGTEVDISTRAAQLFMAPSTHREGGEDAVILVETDSDESGQHLVSARVDGSAKKRLCPTRGFSTFGVSPDGQRLCLMQQDMTTGFYTISVLEGGEGALDPLSTSTMEQVEIPLDRVIMAFFFSPDSTKLLCLATKMSKSELAVARSSMRLGFQLKFQWVIYDCETRNVQLLEEFSPRPFFLKMYLPYFDMFAQGFTPWAPDSKSFAYVSADAAFVQEVPDDGLAPMPRELGPNMEFVSWSFC